MGTANRRGRVAAVAVFVAVAAAVVSAALITLSPSSSTKAFGAGKTVGGATVRRRNLVVADTEPGAVGYADPQTVYDRLDGTITWLPRVGQVIHPGETLFKVDERPVILMRGATPAYRTLSASDGAGSDIDELNRNLVDLGFDDGALVVDDVWQPATTEGVDLLQKSLGQTETDRLALGDVVFEPTDQLVSALDTTIGSTGGGEGGGPSTQAAVTVHEAVPAFVSLHVTPTTHRDEGLRRIRALLRAQAAQLKAQAAKLKAQAGQLRSLTRLAAHSATRSATPRRRARTTTMSSGSSATASAILQTTSTRLIVSVDLPASSQSEAKIGDRVTVELPAGSTVAGTITAVSAVAQNPSSSSAGSGAGGSSSSASTVPVTITLRGRHSGAGLDQAAVSVNFAEAKAKHVLSVPVTALLATSDSTYAVQERTAPYKLIKVTTGLIAGGDVQISGPGIHSGLRVSDSQG